MLAEGAVALNILKFVLSIADQVAAMIHEDKLEEVGKVIQNNANLQKAIAAIRAANAARAGVAEHLRVDPFWLPERDPNAR